MLPLVGAKKHKVKTASVPAPIGGWNARDEWSAMPPTDAITMDNYFPSESGVDLRNGSSEHATGIGGTVETLMPYAFGATKELKAAGNSAIYDVTGSGAVGAAEKSSLTSTQIQYVNFGTAGGNFLWMCNGADVPFYYNGSTYANTALTGITPADVVNVEVHKRRLFLTLENSLTFGYLAVNSISGAVSTFDLASLFKMGGKLIACATWSRDGGAGADDLIAFITSNGEIAVYAGDDPGTAADWVLQGIFRVGAPVGRRCYFKVAGDLVLITQDGYMPMSRVLSTDRVSPELALSDKISGAVSSAVRLYGSNFGWQCLLYPKGGYGLFNVAKGNGRYDQHIVNTTTGAWCRFTGQQGASWAVHNEGLYFGKEDGTVHLADDGSNDDGTALEGDVRPAFNYFGDPGTKRFTMIRPIMQSDGALPVSLGFDTDFNTTTNTYTPSTVTSSGTPWGSLWGSPWGRSDKAVRAWRSVTGIGRCASPRLRTSTTGQNISWQATDFMWEPGVGL